MNHAAGVGLGRLLRLQLLDKGEHRVQENKNGVAPKERLVPKHLSETPRKLGPTGLSDSLTGALRGDFIGSLVSQGAPLPRTALISLSVAENKARFPPHYLYSPDCR